MSTISKKPIFNRKGIKNCDESVKRIRIIMYTVSITVFILVGLFLGFLYIGASCVVKLHFDSDQFADRNINITPENPIIVDMSGRYADGTNASFTINSIQIGVFSQKLERVFGKELYYFQLITGRMVSDELDSTNPFSLISDLNDQTDMFMGASVFFINNTNITKPEPRDISIRYSADYKIFIKATILVDFINPAQTDSYISYFYINNFNSTDSLGRPNGELLIPLKRFTTLDITIKNFTILYPKMEQFFSHWTEESNVTSYPYILDLNLEYKTDSSFFKNDYNK